MSTHEKTDQLDGIAIIGMAGRFPSAPDINQLWTNLCGGLESVTDFTDEQLLSAGVEPSLVQAPNYVKSGILLDGVELFDAKFFGFSPREAQLTDPQHRVFLESSWEAMEDAGYDPDRSGLRIGVFAGTGTNFYLWNNLFSNSDLMKSLSDFQGVIASDNDFLATRVSYKLNLKGPSITIQTACSTSLVAVHLACQSLLNGECDMALAGGVVVRTPQVEGYLYQEGSAKSPDGRCRAFDASANGMTFGSGAGVVVLKRLDDALNDRDNIRAVIRGSAINNDGADKIGYAAPSVDGQANVIAEAQAVAGVRADEITYVEAHGTGTLLGDPIEFAGLTKAFRRKSRGKGFCAIGSVKTNIGHLAAAAGVAGLIKVVLALQHQKLPPSLHFKTANPALDIDNSPFYVQQTLEQWAPPNGQRIAGVSAFGFGGTNAHVIVEEAPPADFSPEPPSWQLLPIAAKTSDALENATDRLAQCLTDHSALSLADVAFTLQLGRKPFAHRRILAAKSIEDAASLLRNREQMRVFTGSQEQFDCPIAFMFTGQAAQYANMGLDIYVNDKGFRECVDSCSEFLKHHLGFDLRQVLYPPTDMTSEAAARLCETSVTQPAMFVVEYALAKLWMKLGVVPDAMIGHSIGEYVAACLAGVFSLQDTLTLVAARGRLMQSMPRGSMLAVRLDGDQLQKYLGEDLSLAVINGPSACVASGPAEAIQRLQNSLAENAIDSRLLPTSHAFHSHMMEPILGSFEKLFTDIKVNPPKIPFMSNVTGTWITPEQAQDPAYWSSQLRHTVRFADGVGELLRTPHRILLEVGPGRTLTSLAKQHPVKASDQLVLPSFGYAKDGLPEMGELMTTLGRLWIAGVPVNWQAASSGQKRRRVPLPTYPFERKRYWIEAKTQVASRSSAAVPFLKDLSIQGGSFDEATDEQRPVAQESTDKGIESRSEDGVKRTDLQEILSAVWREVLGLDKLDLDEDFFALGGDSLLSTQIISRLRALFSMDLPPNSLFDAPTVAQLASYVIAHEPSPGLVEKTARILMQIENMTEEEILQASANQVSTL